MALSDNDIMYAYFCLDSIYWSFYERYLTEEQCTEIEKIYGKLKSYYNIALLGRRDQVGYLRNIQRMIAHMMLILRMEYGDKLLDLKIENGRKFMPVKDILS